MRRQGPALREVRVHVQGVRTAERTAQRRDDQTAGMKRVRAGVWVILLALAGAQAWSSRFYATPDGVSYMDLSDAVQSGQWRELLNGYWSPLYPLLIGLLRAVLRPTPYWEFAVAHL